MSILLAATGVGVTAPEPVTPLALSSSTNIVFDGNSITAPFLVEGMADSLVVALGSARNGAAITHAATPGDNWGKMRDQADAIDALWNPSATSNVLIINEDTNEVWGGLSVEQVLTKRQQYIDRIRSVHPWVIVLWGTMPRGKNSEANHLLYNARLIEIDNWTTDNWTTMGIHGWVPIRDIPMYAHDGSDDDDFRAFQLPIGWTETDVYNPAPISDYTNWLAGGWVHPAAGVLPGVDGLHPMGTGKRAVAAKIADALTDGSLPATP